MKQDRFWQFSSLKSFEGMKSTLKIWLAARLWWLLALSALFLLLAGLNFEKSVTVPNEDLPPREGLVIYILMDRSGSMNTLMESNNPNSTLSRFEEIKDWAKEFIEERPEDMIGLVGFAREAYVLSPPTFDKQALYSALDGVHVVQSSSQDSTEIGYAIYKTSHMIQALSEAAKNNGPSRYTSKERAIILLSDGIQNTYPDDVDDPFRSISLPDAANYAKDAGIVFYMINVSPDLEEKEYAPQRRQMIQATRMTGGQYFSATSSAALQKVLKDLNQLQKGKLRGEKSDEVKKIPLYPYFTVISLIILLIFAVLKWIVWPIYP